MRILDAPALVYSAYPGFPRTSHRESLYLWVDWMVLHFPEDGAGEGAGNSWVGVPPILSVCQDWLAISVLPSRLLGESPMGPARVRCPHSSLGEVGLPGFLEGRRLYCELGRCCWCYFRSTGERFWFFLLANVVYLLVSSAAAAAAKSLQLCPTLCDPIDGSPSGSHPWDLQARILEWVAISFSIVSSRRVLTIF